MRLWSLDRPTCEAALERLIRNGVLDLDGYGRYARGAARSSKPRRRKARPMEASAAQKEASCRKIGGVRGRAGAGKDVPTDANSFPLI